MEQERRKKEQRSTKKVTERDLVTVFTRETFVIYYEWKSIIVITVAKLPNSESISIVIFHVSVTFFSLSLMV